jgi:anti-anti-sigma regulatory factor
MPATDTMTAPNAEPLVIELPDLAELPAAALVRLGAELRERTAPAPRAAGPRIVLDHSRLTGLTSAVIGLMAEVRRTVAAAGGRLAIAGMPAKLMPTFRLSRLDSVFEFHPDAAAAVAALRAG